MWIEKRTSTSYKFVEQYKDPLTNKYRRVSVTFPRNTTHTRKEATIALQKRIDSRLEELGFATKKNITLQKLSNDYLQHIQSRVKLNTYRNALSRLKSIVKELGADTLIHKISPIFLSRYFDRLISNHYKNSTIQKFKGCLNRLFKFAVKNSYLRDNPLNKVEINYPTQIYQQRPEEKYLENDELTKILSYMYERSPHYGRFCEFLYLTGMRYGEAAALSPHDLSTNNDGTCAHINGTLVNGHKQSSPKTISSWRNVTLSKKAIQLCEDELASHPSNQNYIFLSVKGHCLGNTVLNNWLREAKYKFKLNKNLTLHTFRHTHISKLAELGVPLYLIQARVGHKNATTTTQIYLHVTKQAEKLLDNKLGYL